MFALRPYQEEVKAAVYEHLSTRDDNPCAVVPTAGGKTPIMAAICKEAIGNWNGRVLILAHVRELLKQIAEKLRAVCPEVRFGIYSAGLGRRDTQEKVIIAGIQSIYRRACDLDRFDLILVDEAHLIPLEGEGIYRQFLADAKVINPDVRVIGFTATPFRLKTGHICSPGGILNHICHEVGVRELIRDGFLCPLVTRAGRVKVDTSNLHVRGGEFVADEVENLMTQDGMVEAACREIVEQTADRQATLIFASGVKHGRDIVEILREQQGIECGFVCAGTSAAIRDTTLGRFKSGELKYLCNINVLTTGFDAPNIDCVALLRPTASAGLFYQMVGRGFRIHPGKLNCLILDFGGNVLRHGPVDELRIETSARGTSKAPAKECPDCQALVSAGFAKCPICQYEFPARQRKGHDFEASDEKILSKNVTTTTHDVYSVSFEIHKKRNAPANHPPSLRVEYKIGWNQYKCEWICFEHRGYARQKAIAWWRERSPAPVPDTVCRAIEIIESGGLAETKSITVRSVEGEFDRIIGCEIGPLPKPIPVDESEDSGQGEVPF